MTINEICKRLFEMRDGKYATGQIKIIPSVAPERIIGVRTPELRGFEKELNVAREDAIKMSKLTKGYAYAYQVLGYILFDTKKEKLDEDIISKFDTYLREYVYEKIYFDLPNNEREIIIALANSKENKILEIIDSMKMSREKISQYRDKLIKKGILISAGWGKIDFALPRFKEYVLIQKDFD